MLLVMGFSENENSNKKCAYNKGSYALVRRTLEQAFISYRAHRPWTVLEKGARIPAVILGPWMWIG